MKWLFIPLLLLAGCSAVPLTQATVKTTASVNSLAVFHSAPVTNYLAFAFLLQSYSGATAYGLDTSPDLVTWSNVVTGDYPQRIGVQTNNITWVTNDGVCYAFMVVVAGTTNKNSFWRVWDRY